MSSTRLPGKMALASSRTVEELAAAHVPAVASAVAEGSSVLVSEMVNDGVVATSSVLLIGSFFWVGVRGC